jgi:hypothetical protein
MLLTPWLVLLIDIVDNFDIRNILWKDLYIKDWKATSRYPKFRHIEIWDKRSKLSWRALSLKLDFRKISTWPKCIHYESPISKHTWNRLVVCFAASAYLFIETLLYYQKIQKSLLNHVSVCQLMKSKKKSFNSFSLIQPISEFVDSRVAFQ